MAVEEPLQPTDAMTVELEALLAAARGNVRNLRELLEVVSSHLERGSHGEPAQ